MLVDNGRAALRSLGNASSASRMPCGVWPRWSRRPSPFLDNESALLSFLRKDEG